MPRIAPLPADANPDLKDAFDVYRKSLGFVPNSVLIMQRRPKLVKALARALAVTDHLLRQVFQNFAECTLEAGQARIFYIRDRRCAFCCAGGEQQQRVAG